MSAFALPIPPGALTGPFTGLRNAPLPRDPKVHTRSFGAWLEPRYIFGAGTLV
jgi:hypothetical protein